MSERVAVTVAIPVYNRERLVQRALASALAEDVPGLDVLVVDNCSTDGTWDALRRYDDRRVRLVRNDRNLGLFGNFNRCLELARGTYLRFLCSDDVLAAGCLPREVAMMDAHPGVALLSTRYRKVDASGHDRGYAANLFPPGIYPGEASIPAVLWCLAHHSSNPLNYPSGVLLRAESARAVGQFDTSYRMTGDVDFFLRILRRGDLAVLDTVGCEITAHAAMESARLVGDACRDREIYRLMVQYRALFADPAGFDRAVEELAGHAVAACIKYAVMGQWDAAHAHARLVSDTGVPWLRLARAAAGQIRRPASSHASLNQTVPLPPARPLARELPPRTR